MSTVVRLRAIQLKASSRQFLISLRMSSHYPYPYLNKPNAQIRSSVFENTVRSLSSGLESSSAITIFSRVICSIGMPFSLHVLISASNLSLIARSTIRRRSISYSPFSILSMYFEPFSIFVWCCQKASEYSSTSYTDLRGRASRKLVKS